LLRNVGVVPALVVGRIVPEAEELPDSLGPLARRNALEMADGPRWGYDVSRLVNLLQAQRGGGAPAQREGATPHAPRRARSQAEPSAPTATAGTTEASGTPLPGDITSAPAPQTPVSAPTP